jgi:hypothetical protein
VSLPTAGVYPRRTRRPTEVKIKTAARRPVHPLVRRRFVERHVSSRRSATATARLPAA